MITKIIRVLHALLDVQLLALIALNIHFSNDNENSLLSFIAHESFPEGALSSLRLLSYSPYKLFSTRLIPAGTHLLKVNKGNTRTMREICSKLKIKASEQLQ